MRQKPLNAGIIESSIGDFHAIGARAARYVPRQVSLAGRARGSQTSGAKALGLLFCQVNPVPERWNVRLALIEPLDGLALSCTRLSTYT